jgi:hypothetical protein
MLSDMKKYYSVFLLAFSFEGNIVTSFLSFYFPLCVKFNMYDSVVMMSVKN